MRTTQNTFKILNAATANGIGSAMLVNDFRHLVTAFITSGTTTATIKIQGSIQDAQPTWTSSSTAANQWAFVQMINLADQSTVAGATGIVVAGTDISNMYEINTNGLKWINFIISGYSAGSITGMVAPFDNY